MIFGRAYPIRPTIRRQQGAVAVSRFMSSVLVGRSSVMRRPGAVTVLKAHVTPIAPGVAGLPHNNPFFCHIGRMMGQ